MIVHPGLNKKCPKGYKAYKYNGILVCKLSGVVAPKKNAEPVDKNDNTDDNVHASPPNVPNLPDLPDGVIVRTGSRCPNGYKAFKIKGDDRALCRKS